MNILKGGDFSDNSLGLSTENASSDEENYYDFISENVIKAAEYFFNGTKNLNLSSKARGNIKLLSPFNSSIIHNDFDADQNATFNYELQIPEYITMTSMIFCIIIMCLGLIGNIMVNTTTPAKTIFTK
jgi:hypothetical protein